MDTQNEQNEHKAKMVMELLKSNGLDHKSVSQKGAKGAEKEQKRSNDNRCECGKEFKWKQGLYKHRKCCYIYQDDMTSIMLNDDSNDVGIKDLIMSLVKENKDVQLQMQKNFIELIPHIHANNSHNIINNTTHQSLSELEQKQLTKYVEQLDQTTMSTANDTFKKIDETVKLPFEYNGNLMYNKNTPINTFIHELQHITYSVFDRESKRLLTPQFIPGQSTVAELTIPSFNMNYNDFDSNKINTNTYSYY